MRDISQKTTTLRTAVAKATIKVKPKTITLIRRNKMPKGDPLSVARVAAIQAAKNTSQIIPFCHPIPVDYADCKFKIGKNFIEITTEVKAIHKTGVEMEALTAASVAALTIYDMSKVVDESMVIAGISLVSKEGGKSEFKTTPGLKLKAGVLVVSDSTASKRRKDTSGKLIMEHLKEKGIKVEAYRVVSDEGNLIRRSLVKFADQMKLDLILTTGGTGVGPRDVTPEVMEKIFDKEIPGIAETIRSYGQDRTPFSMLSRGKAGVRGKTIIVSLPGSRKGVQEALAVLFPALFHSFRVLRGEGHD